MNREEIKEVMPHREPMLLLDSVEKNENGEAIGKYHVTGEEFFLQGHFPQNPIVPGVILLEILAQTSCILLIEYKGCTPFYTGLDRVKFRNQVKPGDDIVATCTITKSRGIFRFCKGVITVGDKVCASGEFSFALVNSDDMKNSDQ